MLLSTQSVREIPGVFLTVPLRPRVDFKDSSELEDWLKSEKDFLAWLVPPGQKTRQKADKTVIVDEQYTTLKNTYDSFFDEFSAILARITANEDIQNCKKELIRLCARAVDDGLLFSASEELRLCKRMSDWKQEETDKKSKTAFWSNIAVDMLLCLISNNRRVTKIREDVVNTYKSEVSKIDPVLSKIQFILDNESAKSSSTEARIKKLEAQLASSNGSADAKTCEHDSQIKQIREDMQRILTAISNDQYSSDPVLHWRELADKYTSDAQRYFSRMLVTAIAGGFIMIAYVFAFLSSGLNFGTLFGGLVVGSLTLILVWICSRLSVSCNHMAAEAKERSLMALSYMAMSKSGTVSGVERGYFYRAFFQPGSTGLIGSKALENARAEKKAIPRPPKAAHVPAVPAAKATAKAQPKSKPEAKSGARHEDEPEATANPGQ